MLQIDGHVLNIDDYCITEDYDGSEWLEFNISTASKEYKYITELALVITEKNNYVITKIDGNSSRYVHVSADVDKRDFQSVFYEDYDGGSKKLSRTIADFLPSGWTFVNLGNTTDSRTLRLDYGTALDLLNNCAALYSVVFRFNAQLKILTAERPEDFETSTAFVTEELNLRSLQYYGDASEFITRLEARGKDNMTFVGAVVNGREIRKSYVENHEYSPSVIYGYWKDERYTVKEDLYEAAKKKLDEMAQPRRSYECDVIDLKSIEPEKYSAFDLSLYQRVSLKDVSRETSFTGQVVRVKTYPLYPEKNVITLSTTAPEITSQLKNLDNGVIAAQTEAAKATDWLVDSTNGTIYYIQDDSKNIIAQVLKCGNKRYVFYDAGIAYGNADVLSVLLDAAGAFHISSGDIAGLQIASGKLSHGDLTIDTEHGIIDVGKIRLVKDSTAGSVITSTESEGNLTVAAAKKIIFAKPTFQDGEITGYITTAEFDNETGVFNLAGITLSQAGLEALADALAPYLGGAI